jgi:hypothetical protein
MPKHLPGSDTPTKEFQMSTLDIAAFQSDVASRAAELISITNAGRKDRVGRDARLFVWSELKHVSDVLADEALRKAGLPLADLGKILPEAYEAKLGSTHGDNTLAEASKSAFITVLSERGLAAAKDVMLEHTNHVSLSDILNVLQKGYSRVAKRRDAGDVYGRVSLYAEMFVENPTFENFRSLIAEGAYLDASLEQVHGEQYEKTPHRKTSFQDISRSVFEMQSIGAEIARDETRFASMVEQFKHDVESDKVDTYINDGVTRLA